MKNSKTINVKVKTLKEMLKIGYRDGDRIIFPDQPTIFALGMRKYAGKTVEVKYNLKIGRFQSFDEKWSFTKEMIDESDWTVMDEFEKEALKNEN